MIRPKTVLITAGPTREPIDPVRFISNPSTGRMGFELVKEAKRRGYRVILISGPTDLVPPKGVKFIPVVTASEMSKQVMKFVGSAGCLIMAAAVADYRPKRYRLRKIKKKGTVELELTRTPDILSQVSKLLDRRTLVGFALETGDLIKNATTKLKNKGLDLIVANKVGKNGTPFGPKRISAIILDKDGRKLRFKMVTKKEIARALFDRIKL